MDDLALRWESMRPRVIGRLKGQGWSEADAEDLFGAALVKAMEHSSRLEDLEAAEAWFWSLATRLAIDERRKSARRPLGNQKGEIDLDSLVAPESEEGDESVCSCSVNLLEDLPQSAREILKSVDYHGEAVQDFAHRSAITPNSASVRLYRARRALRERLFEVCATTSVAECMDCGCP